MIVAITGASGFVGNFLSSFLEGQGFTVRRLSRQFCTSHTPCPELSPFSDWSEALKGVSIVIHCAAKVHSSAADTELLRRTYYRINVDGVRQLLNCCAESSVKHFIFLSSVKVNGESTSLSEPFSLNSLEQPQGLYANSKYAAEQMIEMVSSFCDFRTSIIRLPLIYGPNPPANFGSLVKLVDMGLPLPFLSINNKRSILGLDNLASFVEFIITNQK